MQSDSAHVRVRTCTRTCTVTPHPQTTHARSGRGHLEGPQRDAAHHGPEEGHGLGVAAAAAARGVAVEELVLGPDDEDVVEVAQDDGGALDRQQERRHHDYNHRGESHDGCRRRDLRRRGWCGARRAPVAKGAGRFGIQHLRSTRLGNVMPDIRGKHCT
jgi:hypothetical protein